MYYNAFMPLSPHSLIKNSKRISYRPPFDSLWQFLNSRSQLYGNKTAIRYIESREVTTDISYSQLRDLTSRLSFSLQSLWKLKSGDSLSFSLPNTPEVILLNYAAWSSGLVSVPLDTTRDTLDRKVYKLQQTKAKLLFTRADHKTKAENREIGKALPDLTIIQISDLAALKNLLQIETESIKPTPDLSSDCLILYTSGTTAMPKGVRLTLTSLFANAESIQEWLEFDQDDRWQVLLPLHHINSITFVNTTLLAGGTVILSSLYSKSNFWRTMAEQQVTGASIVPTIAYDLLSEQDSFDQHQSRLSQVRRFQLGSAPVQPAVVNRFMQKFHIPLYQGYGQTETSLRSAGVPMDLSTDQYLELRKLNSLGAELKYTEVAILDEQGNQLGPDEVGEICIRGPVIMKSYLDNQPATREAFAHNWFHSGDTGYYQEIYGRKFFFLKGRTKEIIKKGAVLISPLAIENALLATYPQLERVYVVGFPDARLGQEIGFVAVTADSNLVNKIITEAAAPQGKIKSLSSFELPRAGIRVTDSQLPKTSTGKIQRIKIKELFESPLLQEYRTVASTTKHTFRLIGPEEKGTLQTAVKINNWRWGKNLQSTLDEFVARASNAVLIGVFDKKNALLGTISALQLSTEAIDKIGNSQPWSTWDGTTAQGTLSTNNHKGTTMVCVAISVALSKTKSAGKSPSAKSTKWTKSTESTESAKKTSVREKKIKLTSQNLKDYLASDQDSVVRFHRRAKGGLATGAKLTKVIPQGRPADQDALGYNVIFEYPQLNKKPAINPSASLGTQLIEAALYYSYQQGIKKIIAYSRPAELSQHFHK